MEDENASNTKESFDDLKAKADDSEKSTRPSAKTEEEVVNGTVERKESHQDEDSDDELIEEDPLPTHLNPAGVYTTMLRQKRKREMLSSVGMPLPPRIIGGVRDQIKTKKQCSCRSSKCLKLYCECYASGMLCTGQCDCKDCHNDGSRETADSRGRSIVDALVGDPFAFHPSWQAVASAQAAQEAQRFAGKTMCSCSKSLCLKAFCECFQAGESCTQSCNCVGCENRRGSRARKIALSNRKQTDKGNRTASSQKSTADRLKPPPSEPRELPPSSYTMPMKIGSNTNVTGISFTKVHPQAKVAAKGSSSTPSSRRLYHDLMNSPSRIVSSKQPQERKSSKKKQKIKETELEAKWNEQTTYIRNFFSTMRQEIVQARKPGATGQYGDPVARKARQVYSSVREDLENVEKVMEAAELDALTRWRLEKQPKTKRCEDNGQKEAPSELACDEELPADEAPDIPEKTQKELTILAAQDAALLREAARIIRRKARELCERRMIKMGS